MNALKYGARQAVQNCIQLKSGERVVIITDRDTYGIAYQIGKVANSISPGNIKLYRMEQFGNRSEDGKNALQFPEELKSALDQADVSFYTATCMPGELATFRSPMIKTVVSNKNLRHAHMPDVNELLMQQGMSLDYNLIHQVTYKVADIAEQAEKIRVITPAGSDFTAYFSQEYRWARSDGLITRGNWMNLPNGETFTSPVSLEGLIVVDGILGDAFGKKYGDMGKTPMYWHVQDGIVQKVECSIPGSVEEFLSYMQSCREGNGQRIGEFGIGTSVGLKQFPFAGNMIQDEKYPGIHIAVGDPLGSKTGQRSWESDVHCDGVLRNPTVYVTVREGKKILLLENGEFVL